MYEFSILGGNVKDGDKWLETVQISLTAKTEKEALKKAKNLVSKKFWLVTKISEAHEHPDMAKLIKEFTKAMKEL